MKTTMTKNNFKNMIEKKSMGLKDIAEMYDVTVPTVRRWIRQCYERKAWADKLIGVAVANDKAKAEEKARVEAEKRAAEEKAKKDENTALVDMSYLLKFPEKIVRFSRLLMPRYCIVQASKIATQGDDPAIDTRKVLEVLERVEPIECEYEQLPRFDGEMKSRHSVSFIRYAVWLRQQNPGIKVVTTSREIRETLYDKYHIRTYNVY